MYDARYLDTLQKCYDEIAPIWGDGCESFESIALVESYRRCRRPEQVRVILLAESHIFTADTDRMLSVRAFDELPGYPTQFAKFVYCLAYGERLNIEGNSFPSKANASQFWKLLYSCRYKAESNLTFAPILVGGCPDYGDRMKNKIRLLQDLKDRGIWLVDASIMALYSAGGKRRPVAITNSVILNSWRCYTRQVVTEAAPDHVIVVGASVSGVLGDDLRKLFPDRLTNIYQPNAHLTAMAHLENFRTCFRICSNL